MDVIDRAEEKARMRAVLFYMMAAALLLSTIFNVGRQPSPAYLGTWILMVALFALNLTPASTMLRRGRVAQLLNDESTQEHRRQSFVAGFWAAMIAGAATMIVTGFAPLAATDVGRVVITAGISAALIAFATLELRAGR